MIAYFTGSALTYTLVTGTNSSYCSTSATTDLSSFQIYSGVSSSCAETNNSFHSKSDYLNIKDQVIGLFLVLLQYQFPQRI